MGERWSGGQNHQFFLSDLEEPRSAGWPGLRGARAHGGAAQVRSDPPVSAWPEFIAGLEEFITEEREKRIGAKEDLRGSGQARKRERS